MLLEQQPHGARPGIAPHASPHNGSSVVTLRMTPELHARLKELAWQRRRSLNAWLDDVLAAIADRLQAAESGDRERLLQAIERQQELEGRPAK